MRLGAVLIASGSHADPMALSGGITVAQRMIASLQKAGTALIAVVTGPADRRMEKQLAQYGVVFLQNPNPEREAESLRLGLDYIAAKCDRLFLLAADRPLLDPDTLLAMKDAQDSFLIPVFRGERGQPLMLDARYADRVSDVADLQSLWELPFLTELPVEDPGVVLCASQAARQIGLIADHEQKLTRLIPDFTISRGKTLVDGKLVALLRLIRETQSVRDACARMQISYSSAWNLLNGAEDALGYPLISRNKGGPSGAGSLLTERGTKLLNACDQFESAVRDDLEALYEKFLKSAL